MPFDSTTALASRWASEALEGLEEAGLLRTLEPLSSAQGAEVEVGGRRLINFSSNDYLGLAADARLAQAAQRAVARWGVGAGASRLVVGDSTAHQSLERALAAFNGSEAARLFNSGYAANLGILSSLLGPGDVVFSDALNHASLIDGCRLSRAKTVVYPHGDVPALERLLAEHPGRRRLVCTDAVFSMDGDLAPVRDLLTVCREHQAALLVDEAHAVGVFGARGSGLCEALGLAEQVDLRVGTLGKALGAFGAYVAASGPVCDFLANRARSLVFSTALPAAVCAAAEEAVRVVRTEPARRERLWENIHAFAQGLQRLGIPAQPRSAIFPWVLGEPRAAVQAAQRLRERGVLAKPIRPPTVPAGTSRLRWALSAAHTPGQLEAALEAISANLPSPT